MTLTSAWAQAHLRGAAAEGSHRMRGLLVHVPATTARLQRHDRMWVRHCSGMHLPTLHSLGVQGR